MPVQVSCISFSSDWSSAPFECADELGRMPHLRGHSWGAFLGYLQFSVWVVPLVPEVVEPDPLEAPVEPEPLFTSEHPLLPE
jgi:hypothetical protein